MNKKRKTRILAHGDEGSKLPPSKLKAGMKGKRIAVSTRIDETNNEKNTSNTGTASLSYNQLKDMCLKSGAQVSSQVHKSVYAVIASDEAVKFPATQRVRKAWKLGIAVVRIAWIQECLQKNQFLPIAPFVISEPENKDITEKSDTEAAAPPRKRKKLKITSQSTNNSQNPPKVVVPEEKLVDLGCCCVCHDSAPEGMATDCEWCVECSVNAAAALTASEAKVAEAS